MSYYIINKKSVIPRIDFDKSDTIKSTMDDSQAREKYASWLLQTELIKDDEEWVSVSEQDNEEMPSSEELMAVPSSEELMKRLWTTMDLNMDYEDFKCKIQEIKRESRSKGHFFNVIQKIQLLWAFSGYASTALTLIKYRSFILNIIQWCYLH